MFLQQHNLRLIFGTGKMHLRPPPWLRLMPVLWRWIVVVDLLFIVAPIVCGGSVFGSCFVIPSSFAIILKGRGELVALY